MEKKEEVHSSQSCMHYLAYYIKVNGKFRKLTMGHCSNKMPFGSFRKTDRACQFYEEKDKGKEQDTESKFIAQNLADISKKLDAIVQSLEAD